MQRFVFRYVDSRFIHEACGEGGNWSLFCPDKAKGLSDVYGKEFEELYERYEREGLANKVVPAADIWKAIIKSQSETGTPYMLYKDACNEKSNQKNLGTIKSSNLCCEILEHTDKDETAVCNLASIALPKFVNKETGEFDYEELHRISKIVTRNLNQVIDRNFYPTDTAKRSNMRHRPIGIGVQGLADVFILCREPFGSEKSREMNRLIFETIYHASLESSCELADKYGAYETFEGSPFSQGILQFDMWDAPKLSGRYDWNAMRERVKKGTRNSLLLAPMPTASTSQILGNNECFEPYTQNIYVRRTLAGEFVVVNKQFGRRSQKGWTLVKRNERSHGKGKWICSKHHRYPYEHQGTLQDGVGNESKGHHRYGRRPRRFHRSIAIDESFRRESDPLQIIVYALLRMEGWSQNWNVLPSFQGKGETTTI